MGEPQAEYAERADLFRRQATALSARFNRLANLRVIAFAASAGCLIWGVAQAAPIVLGAGLAVGAAFVVLVRYHALVGLRRGRATALQEINTQALERLARRWQNLHLRHTRVPDRLHPYAADLDLFGRASLLHLLDTTRTPMGQATLAGWLLQAAPPHTLRERQRGMAELAARLEFRQELEVSGVDHGASVPDPEAVLAWAESGPWLRNRPALLWASRVSPVLLCVLALAQVTGLLSWPAWLLFVFVNAVLWQVAGQRAYATLSRVSVQEGALRLYAGGLELLSAATFEAPILRQLLLVLNGQGHSAAKQVRDLERLTRLVVPRSALVYWVVQTVLLWDVHVLAALENWQARSGARVRTWLESLAEVEALAALGSLAHAHPDWAVPEIDSAASRVEAELAGHPLLAPGPRVDNDYALGPPGRFLLVTGSNMAGKSTFLRTIGTNVVLAQAGGPVCARRFRMPPLALFTSMRVADSLERGVSTFLAELLRLKQVVDAARAGEPTPRLCYLLDEMLQGTNTAERQIAARRILRFLLARGAIGAVSTHDLTLADAPEFLASADCVHFSETLTAGPLGPIMTFDYRLASGLAKSTNALRLLQLLGLDEQ